MINSFKLGNEWLLHVWNDAQGQMDNWVTNHTFWLLSKHGVSPCLAILSECRMKQIPRS